MKGDETPYDGSMTFIDLKLELPDRFAREAEAAGLLSPRRLAKILREEMRRQAFRNISAGAERGRKAGLPEMSPMEIQSLVDEVRKDRRASLKKAA